MADIDKAIGSDDLIDLDVENKDKSINVEVPEEIEVDLSVFERQDDGTLTFGSVLTPDLSEQFKVSERTIFQWLKDGKLESIKWKNKRLINVVSVMGFLLKKKCIEMYTLE